MTELYLKFTNGNGEEKKIAVEGEKFVIGRHSENDLSIVNSKLSRKHIKIERFADVFVISDLQSSNGTTLNENELTDPVSLQNGDILNLGGGLDIEVEIISDNPYAVNSSPNRNGGASKDSEDAEKNASDTTTDKQMKAGAGSASTTGISNKSANSGGSGMGIFFILAPVMGLALIFIIGGAIFIFADRDTGEVAQNNDFIITSDEDNSFLDEIPEDLSEEDNSTKVTEPDPLPDQPQTPIGNDNPPPTDLPDNNPSNPPPNGTGTTKTPQGIETVSTPRAVQETDMVRPLAFNFMRRIARNDPKPILTTKQLAVINSKIKQYRGSAALAANIQDAKAKASQIESLANSKNLKPQFLANAALTKLGNQRGDVLATAQGMLGVLQNLSVSLGTEFANDSLLIIAAYNQGVANENLKMRDTVARLTSKNQNVSSRQVRTIWFLHDENELTSQEFELALRFLAIGTITQNPKAFNVNTTNLTFNLKKMTDFSTFFRFIKLRT
jgi:pSer/pThr/pTyr-binding forkhead associated (FHA) protein